MTSGEQDARASRKVLLMVAELHLRGYQRLRILPYIAPSGIAWRCAIAPAVLFSEDGLQLDATGEFGVTNVTYTSASVAEYFDWTDAKHETPSGLARLFINRFPQIVAKAEGSDWTYAGWFVEMLGLTYPNHFPFSFADWDGPEEWENRTSSWRTTMIDAVAVGDEIRIPLPPANVNGPSSGNH